MSEPADIVCAAAAYMGPMPYAGDGLVDEFIWLVRHHAKSQAIALQDAERFMQSVQSPPSPPRKCSVTARGLERGAGRACGSIAVATCLRPAMPDPTGCADVGNGSDMVATPEGAD